MVKTLSPADLKTLLRGDDELGLFDVREEGVHSACHLLYAAPLPLSRLELLVEDLAPRKTAPLVLVDDDDGLSERAAAKLEQDLGYRDVSILSGGVPGWQAAGYEVFSGVHVPSKAFGEYVEVNYDTPRIDAKDLQAKVDAGEDLIILDSRPMDEYQTMNIPGGIDCPGAELVYRVSGMAPNPDTLVIVNCAGRTRSIIGAQSLINAGIPNKVMALKDGTMGWHLSGLTLQHGKTEMAATPTPEALEQAKANAENAARRFGVHYCDRDEMAAWQAEVETRSLYLLDVRTVEEFEAGHMQGAQHAPGGQLVQGTERWLGVLGSRVVLLDNEDCVRATMTASWLNQMGWNEIAVLRGGLDGLAMETGARPLPLAAIAVVAQDEISPQELKSLLDAGQAKVVDFADSRAYKAGHIPAAWFAIRAQLPETMPRLADTQVLVFTSPDGVIAKLAAPEASELTDTRIRVLAGGTDAWIAAGFEMRDGLENMANERVDVWLKPYDFEKSVEDKMREYLTWEVDLVNAIERDGDHRFRLYD
jgi:rhodanese-related sulfurtransferase